MEDISLIHEKVYQFLLDKHEIDNKLLFLPRKINNKNRFERGYWFIGNDSYLQPTFWQGGDVLRKIHNIGFSILLNGNSYIELSAKNKSELLPLFQEIVTRIPGFQKAKSVKSINRWYKYNNSTDYMHELENFMNGDKIIIDQIVKEIKPKGLSLIEPNEFLKYLSRINSFRNSIEFKTEEINIQTEIKNNTFEEFDGIKTYTVKELRVVIARHGKILREMMKILHQSNVSIGKDRLRDLYILNESGNIETLFELKTDVSTSSIYCAIGQLLIYVKDFKLRPRIVIVLPEQINKDLEAYILEIGFEVLYYDFDYKSELLNIDFNSYFNNILK